MNLETIAKYKKLNTLRIKIESKIINSNKLIKIGLRLPKCTGERATFFKMNKNKIYCCSLQGVNELADLDRKISDIESLEGLEYSRRLSDREFRELLALYQDVFN